MPHYPILMTDQSILNKIKIAEYNDYLTKMEFFWEQILDQGCKIKIPEEKVMNAIKSYIIHCFLCQNNISENEIEQVVNRFQYNQFWTSIGYYGNHMYNVYNYPDISKKLNRYIASIQKESGEIISQPGYWKQVCNALATFGEYIKITNDTDFAVEVLPRVVKAVDWLKEKILSDRFGLMPVTNTKDGPFLVGHYTGDNFWALLGFDGAVKVAKASGDEKVINEIEIFYAAYRQHFLKQLRIASERNNNIIPVGMDVEGGVNWEDLLAGTSSILLDPFDPLVNNTYSYYREHFMKEGLSTHGSFLHHWNTILLTQTALRRNEQEYVLNDIYSMLLHTGSCHEGFEYCVFPSTRDYATRASLPLCVLIKTLPYWYNFPCNGRFASWFNILVRDMLLREEGNNLHVFSSISPEWVKPGDTIQVIDAPTYFGNINLSAIATEEGLYLKIEPLWNKCPESIILHMPFFAEINSIMVNDTEVSLDGQYLELPIHNCYVNLTWEIDPSIEYSYTKFVSYYLSGII